MTKVFQKKFPFPHNLLLYESKEFEFYTGRKGEEAYKMYAMYPRVSRPVERTLGSRSCNIVCSEFYRMRCFQKETLGEMRLPLTHQIVNRK